MQWQWQLFILLLVFILYVLQEILKGIQWKLKFTILQHLSSYPSENAAIINTHITYQFFSLFDFIDI